ncbi:MAG: D-alanine--D-alanine ligase, partial [Verrucomicrobiota bacterium]
MKNTLDRLNITVLLGGPSSEREISLKSGASVARALRSLGHQVEEVDPRTGELKLPANTEVVFIALHGTYGEDGTVQQQLEALNVPFTGCDSVASRVSFDKVLTKQRCSDSGIAIARFFVLDSPEAF